MQGQEVGKLHYDLEIDDNKLRGQLDDADKSVRTFGDRLNEQWDKSVHASKIMLGAVTAVGAATVAFGVSSVKAFEESQNVIAQTNAVLKSTGSAAGVTADEVGRLARELQRATKFSDEEVQSAENLLLTFTSIGKDIFPDATKIVLDMSTALGQDLKSSAIQLGKALQDPILGVSALRRVGVNFNESQQEVIANLVNTGRAAEAQRLIMAELTKEFGGSAVAAGRTFSGSIAKMKNEFNDLQEAVGGTIIQALGPLLTWFGEWIDNVTDAGGLIAYLNNVFNEHKKQIELIAGAIIGALVPAVIALSASFVGLVLELAPFMIVGAALFYLWNNNRELFYAIAIAIGAVAIAVTVALLPAIIAATVAFGGMAVAVIAATWPFVLLGIAVAAVAYVIIRNWQSILDFIGASIEWFRQLPGRIRAAIGDLGGLLWDAGAKLMAGMINGVKAFVGELVGAVRNAVGSAINAVKGLLGIHSPSTVFKEIGHNVTRGFVQGIADGADAAANAMGNLSAKVINPNINLTGQPSTPATTQQAPAAIGAPVINIGQVNNMQDENWVIRRLDRNAQLESMGGSPASA